MQTNNSMRTNNNRVRVLHLITRLIVGGAQENTIYTVNLLNIDKYHVSLISGPQTGSEGSMIEETFARGIELCIIPELVREINPIKDLIALIKIYRVLKKGDYTIIHTHSSKAGIIGRLAAKMAKTPIIVHTIHGWSFHDNMSSFKRKTYILLEKLSASFSNAMIVVAQKDIDKGLKENIGYPYQYHLIRSAIPIKDFDRTKYITKEIRYELGIPLDAPVLGNIGRFSEQKNPLEWVNIASQVHRQIPECRFLMVGDGPLRKQVELLIEEEKLSGFAIVPGLRRDVARLLSVMDVFLLTSLWEGLPRVIPQAMMMQIPIVSYRVDGAAEAIYNGESGYLCEPNDIDAAAYYCIKLLINPALRLQMGINGKKYATREFDLSKMIEQIDNLYSQLITQTKAHDE
jgi:glycosyltransferase involved in cell wall biosynthesis